MKRAWEIYVVASAVVGFSLLLVAFAQAAEPVKLHPQYACSGTTPAGRRYQLTLVVKEQGATVEMEWLAAGKSIFKGFGVRKDNHLAVLYADGQDVSVVLYEVLAGQLIGWGPTNEGNLAQEVCIVGKSA